MNFQDLNGLAVTNLGRMNIVLGKNGCGKSYLLKQAEEVLRGREGFGTIRYVSPERGGFLEYEPNVDTSIGSLSAQLP